MNNTNQKTSNKKSTTTQTIALKQTEETFLKRIKEVKGQEKELLLKLYAEIIEDIK
jgi:hypothetical protein